MKTPSSGLISLLGIAAVCCASCKKEHTQNSHAEAERLFHDIHKVTLLYTDSILNARDSISLFELMNRYEEKLEEVNYAALPDTDYNLTEGENDTIKMAMDSLVSAKVRRLRELGERKLVVETDSLVIDSAGLSE